MVQMNSHLYLLLTPLSMQGGMMCIEDITCHEILVYIVAVPKRTQIYRQHCEKLHQPHIIEQRAPVCIIKVNTS